MCVFFSTNAVVISESVRCRFIVTMDESRIAVRNISLSISSSDTETRTQEAHFLTDVRIPYVLMYSEQSGGGFLAALCP